MFRKTLLATSALVLGTSVAFAAAHAPAVHQLPAGSIAVSSVKGHPLTVMVFNGNHNGSAFHPHINLAPIKTPSPEFDNLSKDANAEFISFYGYFIDAYSYSSTGSYSESGYENDAIPFTGAGKKAHTVKVPMYTYGAAYTFTPVIYSSSGGHPLGVVESGSAITGVTTSSCCTALQTSTLPKKGPVLASATTYFLGVTTSAAAGCQCEVEGLWLMDDTNITSTGANDQYQYGDHYSTSGGYVTNYNSGWLASPLPPTEPAAEVN